MIWHLICFRSVLTIPNTIQCSALFRAGILCIIMVFCLGAGVPRHSAGGVGMFLHMYVRGGTYGSQCTCVNNGSGELHQSYYIYIPGKTYLQHWDSTQK